MEIVTGEPREAVVRRHRLLAQKYPTKYAGQLDRLAELEAAGDVDAEARRAGILEGLAEAHACRECGRALRNRLSRERGIGPECWGKRRRPFARAAS